MIGLDTNIVLRYLFNDDPAQSPEARRTIGSLDSTQPGWIAVTTILEIAWVMKRKRHATRGEILAVLASLLTEDSIVVENTQAVARALQQFRRTNADFADCLIAESARMAGCNKVLTFDETAARDLGMERIG